MGGLNSLLNAARQAGDTESVDIISERVRQLAEAAYPSVKQSPFKANVKQSIHDVAAKLTTDIEAELNRIYVRKRNEDKAEDIQKLCEMADDIVGDMFVRQRNDRMPELLAVLNNFYGTYAFAVEANLYHILGRVHAVYSIACSEDMNEERIRYECEALKDNCTRLSDNWWRDQNIPLEIFNALRCIGAQMNINMYIASVK